MSGGVHVGAGVGEHGHPGFFKAVLFIAVGRNQLGWFCAGINGHGFGNEMGQIDNSHGQYLLSMRNV